MYENESENLNIILKGLLNLTIMDNVKGIFLLISTSERYAIGASLVVQWLNLHASSAGGRGPLVRELRSCMLCGMAKKKKILKWRIILRKMK